MAEEEPTGAVKKWEELSDAEWLKMIEEKKENRKKKEPHMKPHLPEDYEMIINQRFPKSRTSLFIQKTLTATDVNKDQGRLNMPSLEVEDVKLLNDQERRMLRQEQNIEIPVYHRRMKDGHIKETQIIFSQKNLHKNKGAADKVSSIYVFTKTWNSLVSEDGLKEGDEIHCWLIRDKNNLLVGMAVVKIELFINTTNFWERSHHHGFKDPFSM